MELNEIKLVPNRESDFVVTGKLVATAGEFLALLEILADYNVCTLVLEKPEQEQKESK